MRKVIYNCDFCREEIKDLTQLRTVSWKCDIIPQRYVLKHVDRNDPLDRQVCLDCIKMFKEFEL